MINYRSDIDGLRAFAVISVVLFHFNSNWLPGGFIGVDIFFVISGFLITGNIYKSIKLESFSFFDFYSRRIRRIIPAASMVVLATLMVGHFILVPEDLTDLSISALASQLSIANIYFTYFLGASYFAPDAELQPLLHYWSLGVEEQFYIFWPVLLLIFLNRLSVFFVVLASMAIAIASFVFAQMILSTQPMFAYYMLPTRAGQLLVGAICFLISINIYKTTNEPNCLKVGIYNVAGWIGFLGVVTSMLYLNKASAYPGINAIFPTVAAGLIVLFSPYGSLKQFLSLKPIVFLGLISYSMYLWHWPILVYSRYVFSDISWYWFVPYIILLITISWVSWKYVEQVFRKKGDDFKWIFAKQYVLPSFLIFLVSAFYIFTKGVGFYANANLASNISTIPQPVHRDQRVCQEFLVTDELISDPRCDINPAYDSKALLWGDSNAAHFVPLLAEVASEKGFSFRNIAHSACPPLLFGADEFITPRRKTECLASINVVRNSLENYPVIILSAAWGFYYNNNPGLFEQRFEETLNQLINMNKNVIVIGRMTAFPDLDTKCIHKQFKVPYINCDMINSNSAGVDELSSRVNEYLEQVSEKYLNVSYLDFNHMICNENGCSPFLDDNLVYFDSTHLSAFGSKFLGVKLLGESSLDEFSISLLR